MNVRNRIAVFFMAVSIAAGISLSAHAQSSQAHQVRGPISNVRFAIYNNGIYPREVHVVKGAIAVSIEDFSTGTSGVVVDRVEGKSRAGAGRVERNSRASWRGKSIIVLEPGQYEVYSTENPDARALMIVEPK